ncbi:MAG: hypothetical protein KBS41_01850, partial [Oscillospiraceae bacterium]|nr:hypothetical protein [Candidatus Equicaccousia limihippi]
IYLIEVPFSPLSWGLFGYYKHWFMWTVLTLPGAAIAFFVKKQNCLSAVILSVANLLLAYSSMYYLNSCIYNPPHHILSSVFCAAEAVFLIFVLLKPKKPRILALSLFGLSMIASVLYTFIL